MDFSRPMIIVGSIIIAFGILFITQSQSIVGPDSSFMYRNPEWAVNGSIIAAVGAVIIIGGIAASIKRKKL
ncbi:MAG: hypothetical protein HZA83_01515 [Thaumarchaeota archaeon]|nr:hypothetical protein [Nitrososphaerota archaeon]